MKNYLILTAFLMAPAISQAQFKTGQIFFGGGANFSLNDSKYNDSQYLQNYKYGTYSHDINYTSGYFTKENRAIGWTLNQSLSLINIQNSNSTANKPRTLRNISFGVGRFVEHYKSLTENFALYVRPGFGVAYSLRNQDGQQSGNYFVREQTNTFTLGVNVSGGVAWVVSPKWALYGGIAFANPIHVSAGWSNTGPDNGSGSTINQTRDSFFDYGFTPDLYSGSISLGFRYLVTRSDVY